MHHKLPHASAGIHPKSVLNPIGWCQRHLTTLPAEGAEDLQVELDHLRTDFTEMGASDRTPHKLTRRANPSSGLWPLNPATLPQPTPTPTNPSKTASTLQPAPTRLSL